MSKSSSGGFTLIEMMITVAILAVLTVASVSAYRKYMDNGKKSEVVAMFAEIRAKEEAYRAEYSAYQAAGSNGAPTSDTDFYPSFNRGHEPSAKAWSSTQANWKDMAIQHPKGSQTFCVYAITAGTGSSSTPAGAAPTGTYCPNSFGGANPLTPWWCAVGSCDNDNDATTDAIFVVNSTSDVMYEQNIHN